MQFKLSTTTNAAAILSLAILAGTASAQRVEMVHNQAGQKVEVTVDGKPFTSYIYPGPDKLKKAVLYPIRTSHGTLVTRGWPMDPRAGERVDHPHHVGVWLNYEDVNQHDFWNNSNTPPKPNGTYGTIVHTGVKSMKSGKRKGELSVTADWLDKNGNVMLKENTTYVFGAVGERRIIDRITTLTAANGEVEFPDVKDGLFAIRVARELEHPSTKPEIYTDASGVATKVPVMNNEGITGNYRNSNGVEGEEVWSKRAAWTNLRGKIGGEKISVAIIDHPQNVGYPAYWHARGYGLFAVNPLGQKAFTNGKESLNLKLKNSESTTFRYRLVIDSDHIPDAEMKELETEFAKVK